MDAPRAADLTRRNFTKTAAALAVAPLLPSLAACARRDAPASGSGPGEGGAASTGGSEAAVVDALTEVVRREHGERLGREQLRAVRASIRANLGSLRPLREVRLPIGTGPALGIPVPPRT